MLMYVGLLLCNFYESLQVLYCLIRFPHPRHSPHKKPAFHREGKISIWNFRICRFFIWRTKAQRNANLLFRIWLCAPQNLPWGPASPLLASNVNHQLRWIAFPLRSKLFSGHFKGRWMQQPLQKWTRFGKHYRLELMSTTHSLKSQEL